jgi:hypothetical protein
MPATLKAVLTQAVKATHSRFSILCNEMGCQHDKLLYTEVRWLSQGEALSHLFELRSQVQIFLSTPLQT